MTLTIVTVSDGMMSHPATHTVDGTLQSLSGTEMNDFGLVHIEKEVVLPKPVVLVFQKVFKMSNT